MIILYIDNNYVYIYIYMITYSPTLHTFNVRRYRYVCRMGNCIVNYHPYLVSLLVAELLSLDFIKFLMLFRLVCM